MHSSALLILTSHVSSLCKGDAVARILADVKKVVTSTLYVHLQNTSLISEEKKTSTANVAQTLKPLAHLLNGQKNVSGGLNPHVFNSDVLPFVTKFYSEAAAQCEHIDVNVLLHNIGMGIDDYQHPLQKPVHCVLIDQSQTNQDDSDYVIRRFVKQNYILHPLLSNSSLSTEGSPADSPDRLPIYKLTCGEIQSMSMKEKSSAFEKKDSVVLGGTFDRLHAGHKVLLSEAILMAKRKIVIGVSTGPLLDRKILKEIIQPISLRKKLLEDFIATVARIGLEINIEIIEDPYGPSITDPDLQVILVSKETEKGGHMVNEKRLERGLSLLDVCLINQGLLIQEQSNDGIPFQEVKVSSSSRRFKLLGTLLKSTSPHSDDTFNLNKNIKPYVIGLTGGIAAGKSSIAKRLEKLGAIIIDCDKLGHLSYTPGTQSYQQIVDHFGQDVVSFDSTIDRKRLGQKVFSDKSQLDVLNSIVWPEIEKLCKSQIKKHMMKLNEKYIGSAHQNNYKVFVLDAAILLEAGWDKFSDEVWVVSISQKEAITRIIERNNISEEDAVKRIQSQSSTEWRVQRANVVLSTLWQPSVTQELVQKAWDLLQLRLSEKKGVASNNNRCSQL